MCVCVCVCVCVYMCVLIPPLCFVYVAHFKVHVRGPGKVALEGVASPGSFLSLRFGVAGIGEERSPFSELLVKEIGAYSYT